MKKGLACLKSSLIQGDIYTFKVHIYSFKSAAAAQAVGVSTKSLLDWYVKYAPEPTPCGENATLGEIRDEIKRLRRQLRRAELEHEILKKATAYFAKESL